MDVLENSSKSELLYRFTGHPSDARAPAFFDSLRANWGDLSERLLGAAGFAPRIPKNSRERPDLIASLRHQVRLSLIGYGASRQRP